MAHPTPELAVPPRHATAPWKHRIRCRRSHLASRDRGDLMRTIGEPAPETVSELAMQRAGGWGERAQGHFPIGGPATDTTVGCVRDLGLEGPSPRHVRREDTGGSMEIWGGSLRVGLEAASRRRGAGVVA